MNSSHFSDTRLIDFPHANPLVTKLLDRYGFQLDESPSATAVVKLRIGLPQGSILLWDRATSLPRGPQRRHLLRSVSLTFQNALRCWLPYLWLSNPAHWDDPYLLWPMLIYASSRTFIQRQPEGNSLGEPGVETKTLQRNLAITLDTEQRIIRHSSTQHDSDAK